jgi:hypothetical protein
MVDLEGKPYPENKFFRDDVFVITEMLKREWSLGPEDTPIISWSMEGTMVDARIGYIFVYHVSRYNSMSSTDYATIQRTSFIDIRISTRSRPKLYEYTDEVYRILYANRRMGPDVLNGYTWLEITNDRIGNDAQGWYSVLISLKMMSYAYPIYSPGFGEEINARIDPRNDEWVGRPDNEYELGD